jgi:APA family basic amino acid/polyamine antiporter
MADDGLLPRWLKFRGEAPRAATIAQAVIASTLVMLSDLQGLLSYLGLTLSLSAACSVACLFLPSIRRQLLSSEHGGRGYFFIAPLFYISATLISAALLTYNNPKHLLATMITFLVGAAAYVATQYNRGVGEKPSS